MKKYIFIILIISISCKQETSDESQDALLKELKELKGEIGKLKDDQDNKNDEKTEIYKKEEEKEEEKEEKIDALTIIYGSQNKLSITTRGIIYRDYLKSVEEGKIDSYKTGMIPQDKVLNLKRKESKIYKLIKNQRRQYQERSFPKKNLVKGFRDLTFEKSLTKSF